MDHRRVLLALTGTALALWASVATPSPGHTSAGDKELSASCPVAGTTVPLAKAMNASFIKDFKDCDVVVEAIFFKMGNQGYRLGKYNTKDNTTFQVLEPGGSPTAAFGAAFGTFAGTPKDKSSILFELKQGDPILLRGSPIAYGFLLSKGAMVAVFHAESVTKK